MISSTCGRVYVHGDCFHGTKVSVVPFLPHRYSRPFLFFTKSVCRTYISYASSLARTVLVYLPSFRISLRTQYCPRQSGLYEISHDGQLTQNGCAQFTCSKPCGQSRYRPSCCTSVYPYQLAVPALLLIHRRTSALVCPP
jgi:hypothetical protein